MQWKFRRKQKPSVFPSNIGPATTGPMEAAVPSQQSRRGLLGKLRTVGVAIAAVSGVGVLTQHNAPVAHADNIGNFSNSDPGSYAPAVTATNTGSGAGISGSSTWSYGVVATSTHAAGVVGLSNSSVVDGNFGVYGGNGVSNGVGVYGDGGGTGVSGSGGMIGVAGSSSQTGVSGGGGGAGVNGSGGSFGVYGSSTIGIGVYGISDSIGVYAFSQGTSQPGLYATGGSVAGFFNGNVQVNGNLSKAGGSFLIDHPLDPTNKKLYHSFVESPDMKNIYDGIAVLDAHGEAVVVLPDWFGALNNDFRYQLTCLGSHAPVYISHKIQNNQFTIAGGQQGMEISWLVTGIRQDPWAQQNRIPVEEEKSARELGFYYHPEVYGQPADKSLVQQLVMQPTTLPV